MNMPWGYCVIDNYKLQVLKNISGCYVKFRHTKKSCPHLKISQSINMQLISTCFIEARKLCFFIWKIDKRTVEDTFASRFQITENQSK